MAEECLYWFLLKNLFCWWCCWFFVLVYCSYCIFKFADFIYSFGAKLQIYSSHRTQCISWWGKKIAQQLLMTNTKISNPRRTFFDLDILSVLKSLGSKIRGRFWKLSSWFSWNTLSSDILKYRFTAILFSSLSQRNITAHHLSSSVIQ